MEAGDRREREREKTIGVQSVCNVFPMSPHNTIEIAFPIQAKPLRRVFVNPAMWRVNGQERKTHVDRMTAENRFVAGSTAIPYFLSPPAPFFFFLASTGFTTGFSSFLSFYFLPFFLPVTGFSSSSSIDCWWWWRLRQQVYEMMDWYCYY